MAEPVHNGTVSAAYGVPGSWGLGYHPGVDYVPLGSDFGIYACTPGEVIAVGWAGDYGWRVLIQWGTSRQVLYAHMPADTRYVSVGQQVSTGQRIGTVGATGNVNGAHVHVELRRPNYSYSSSTIINPAPAINHQEDDDMPSAEEVANAVWNKDMQAYNENEEYGSPAESTGRRLRRAADRAGRALVVGRNNRERLDNLEAKIDALSAQLSDHDDSASQTTSSAATTAASADPLAESGESEDTPVF